MYRMLRLSLAITAFALFTGCGGGGGSGGNPGPVISTSAFNLLAASKSQAATANAQAFTVSGTINGFAIVGSGTATFGAPTSGTFEGAPALQRVQTTTGSLTVNGQTLPIASSSLSWTDNNYIPLGSSSTSEYQVITGTPTIPSAAHVADTGPLYTANRYANSTKATLLGTEVVTYVVEADTATTALVTIISTTKNTSGAVTSTATAQMRVTTANTFTRVKETLLDPGNASNLVITY